MSLEISCCTPSISKFDEIPGLAFVDITTVRTLFGCSVATVWRRVKDGQIPAPYRLGKRSTRWQVAELRVALTAVKGGAC